MRIADLKSEAKEHVLWLHQEAFGGLAKEETPCIPCKGGCCVNCAGTDGYLYGLPKAELSRLKKAYAFDKKAGFKGATGCLLPVEERSAVCVGFICSGFTPGELSFRNDGTTSGKQIAFSVKSIGFADMIKEIVWDKDNYLKK